MSLGVENASDLCSCCRALGKRAVLDYFIPTGEGRLLEMDLAVGSYGRNDYTDRAVCRRVLCVSFSVEEEEDKEVAEEAQKDETKVTIKEIPCCI